MKALSLLPDRAPDPIGPELGWYRGDITPSSLFWAKAFLFFGHDVVEP